MNTVAAVPVPRTIRARVLLGWFSRDNAVRYLQSECYFNPALTDAEAERRWREYRDRTEALPEREALAPARIALNNDERAHAQRFLAFLRGLGPTDIQEVIKVDVTKLVAHQYAILMEKGEAYRNRTATLLGWLHEALPCQQPTAPLVRASFSQNGLNTAVDIDLPHGEFAFLPDQYGSFSARQLLRHVTAMVNGNRMWLWAGYHRTFARMLATNPAAAVPSAVVALTRNTLVPANQPAGAAAGLLDDIGPFGRRPALLGDFLDDDLFMEVYLRKKRFQIQMRSTWVALDDNA